MKIGKITFDGYNNYGNILQNYALQEYLKEFGCEVETLWHSPDERISEFWKWNTKEKIKYILNYESFRDEINHGVRAWELARRVRGLDFVQRYINTRYDISSLKDISEEYDLFVVGSDQVWNPSNPDLYTAFLEFAAPEKRVSFAVSIGAQDIPQKILKSYKSGLEGMRFISVREERAAEIIFEITGRKVDVILDPVFCVKREKWENISIRPYWMGSNEYIFAYFLGPVPQYVYKLANKYKLDVIKCFDRNNINRYIVSPEEWLYLISKARFVCTDSFHATAFSIIFDRSFSVSAREENEGNKQMITRIESILKIFDLDEHFYNYESDDYVPDEIKHSNQDIIKKELKRTDKFIKEIMKNVYMR